MSDLAKQLKIKTGVCKRVVKDLSYYNKEKAEQEEKIEKMSQSDDAEDQARLKQQKAVLEETLAMIPDSKNRIDNAYEDLKSYIAKNGDAAEIAGTELLEAAQKVLQDVETTIYGDKGEEKKDDVEEEEY
jgi:tubulin-specific chaperone A